ncbi:sigma factor [Micromonospora sp. URMC 106]|uniref:sigma factor n=1 Tax=Micromonospora sp. URMC 106 TaxID=3423408 RepID=UPI003F1DAD58
MRAAEAPASRSRATCSPGDPRPSRSPSPHPPTPTAPSKGGVGFMRCKCGVPVMRGEGVEQVQKEFAEFYRASRDGCLRAVLAVVGGDAHLAEELVAEGFARAFTRWGEVSRHPAPAAWVVRTALNTRVSWWRKRRREVPLTAYDDRSIPASEGGVDASLLEAVRLLPRRQREVRRWGPVGTRSAVSGDRAPTAGRPGRQAG